MLGSLKAAERKRAKRPPVANVGDERKARPCSPQGRIHHGVLDAERDATLGAGNIGELNSVERTRQVRAAFKESICVPLRLSAVNKTDL